MVVLTSILAILFLATSILLGLVVLKYGRMLMNVEDNTQLALDLIDQRYYRLTHIIKDRELLSNDPVVRQFLEEVEETRNDILAVAQTLIHSTADFQLAIGEEEAPATDEPQEQEPSVNITRGQET